MKNFDPFFFIILFRYYRDNLRDIDRNIQMKIPMIDRNLVQEGLIVKNQLLNNRIPMEDIFYAYAFEIIERIFLLLYYVQNPIINNNNKMNSN